MSNAAKMMVLKGGLIRDTVDGGLYRVLYISPDDAKGYWIRVDSSSNIPTRIDLKDVSMRLETRTCEAVIDHAVEESSISPASS